MPEKIIRFGPGKQLVGILTEPEQSTAHMGPVTLFLAAGLIHKIGPNRLYVKLSRALADLGYISFRFDFSGIGDSGALGLSREEEIRLAIDEISNLLDTHQFVLSGLCTGAFDGFKAAILDDRIIGLYLINGVFFPDSKLKGLNVGKRLAKRYYRKYLFDLGRWRKILSGKSKVLSTRNIWKLLQVIAGMVLNWLQSRPNEPSSLPKPDVLVDWKILIDKEVKIYCLFSEGDDAIDVFNALVKPKLSEIDPNGLVQYQLLLDIDHTFTPVWSQEILMDLLLKWVQSLPLNQLTESSSE